MSSGTPFTFSAIASTSAPGVLLLDTNVVILSWRYRVGDEGFDLIGALQELAAQGQERLALDLLSLEELFALAQMSATPRFSVAPATLDELQRSRESDAEEIRRWAIELTAYAGVSGEWPFDAPSHTAAELLAPSVTGVDAALLVETRRLGADALLTCDYRLLRRRGAGGPPELKALTPFEVEDWMLGCRRPPWEHRGPCRAYLSRVALLSGRRGLRLGDPRGAGQAIRAAK